MTTIKDYLSLGQWDYLELCYCDGPLEMKFKHKVKNDVRVNIKPEEGTFKIFNSETGDYNKPISRINDYLKIYGVLE